jgi:uncharacterized protein YjiS (DUF1127 family)
VAGGILNRQVSITTWLPYALGGSIMRPQTRGWIMPEADMVAMLRLIDEKICSQQIETRHRDALIRLREILENDLNDLGLGRPSDEHYDGGNKAA